MKFTYFLICTIIVLAFSAPVFAQKYKSAADTGKLNVEYAKVQNKIADLKVKLASAQSDLPEYQTKAVNAGNTAQTAAATSDTSSSKATSGNIADAKDAKNNANEAYDKAKDAQSANKKVGKQNEKIRKLSDDLTEQNRRLKDLDIMRAAIMAQTPGNLNH